MSTSGERLYDLSLIEEMACGDEDFMKELAETFLSSVPPVVDSMLQYSMNQEWIKMADAAHNLKSNIDTLQIMSIRDEIRIIESNGKNLVDLDVTHQLVEKVAKILNTAMDQIKVQFKL